MKTNDFKEAEAKAKALAQQKVFEVFNLTVEEKNIVRRVAYTIGQEPLLNPKEKEARAIKINELLKSVYNNKASAVYNFLRTQLFEAEEGKRILDLFLMDDFFLDCIENEEVIKALRKD